MYSYLTDWYNEICRTRMLFNKIEKRKSNMTNAYVNIQFGGKDLNCELDYDEGIDGTFCKLIKVEMLMEIKLQNKIENNFYVHTEDITDFLDNIPGDIISFLESECIYKIQSRGYV